MIKGLSYNPTNGHFVWVASSKSDLNGRRAGTLSKTNGYRYIKHKGKNVPEHRLAWETVNGKVPDGLEIDHINRNKADNRISNLRLVTREENLVNREFAPNLCGATGVSKHKNGLYRARYRNKTLYFKSVEDARAGYTRMLEEHLEEIEEQRERNKKVEAYLKES